MRTGTRLVGDVRSVSVLLCRGVESGGENGEESGDGKGGDGEGLQEGGEIDCMIMVLA